VQHETDQPTDQPGDEDQEQAREVERRALRVNEACKAFGFSRSTFYRMREELERDEVVFRLPPETGPLRVDPKAFLAWAKRRHRSSA